MSPIIFNQLIENIKLDTANEVDVIGFSSKVGKNEITFYAESKDMYKIIIEDFGRMKKGKWEQDEPTAKQIEVLQEITSSKVLEILENNKEEEEYFNGDYYDYYGVSRAMFY